MNVAPEAAAGGSARVANGGPQAAAERSPGAPPAAEPPKARQADRCVAPKLLSLRHIFYWRHAFLDLSGAAGRDAVPVRIRRSECAARASDGTSRFGHSFSPANDRRGFRPRPEPVACQVRHGRRVRQNRASIGAPPRQRDGAPGRARRAASAPRLASGCWSAGRGPVTILVYCFGPSRKAKTIEPDRAGVRRNIEPV
jgi:hypothetical protein